MTVTARLLGFHRLKVGCLMPRPMGVLRLRRNEGVMQIHQICKRTTDDGQDVRIHPVPYEPGKEPTNNHRRFDFVDVVLPANGMEHATGLILRFPEPADLDEFQKWLSDARLQFGELREPRQLGAVS